VKDDPFSIKPQFWLDRELAKVKDPKRRQWLAEKVFAGEEGYEKFLKIMRQREGANEFRTGEWQKKLPKYREAELELKRRPCIGGCKRDFPPRFTPWGELFEDWTPICSTCNDHIKRKNTDMTDQTKQADTLTSIQDALTTLEKGKQTLKSELKSTLAKAKTELSVLMSPQLGFTFDAIFSDPDFADIVETFQIKCEKIKTQTRTKAATTKKQNAKTTKLKKGGLKETILELMGDGKERKRPEIKAALEKKNIKTSNLYGKSGVEGLVKEGKLKVHGKGRAAVYSIAK